MSITTEAGMPRSPDVESSAQQPDQDISKQEPVPGEDVVGNYRLVRRILLDYVGVVITKWQSEKTGLRVVHIDYESPIIHGSFALATEIFDDSGCPHTLEHLVFCGSELYPERDSLAKAASQGLCSMTNAYTTVDSTVYTVSAADEASFLSVLKVYVDHILYPQLPEGSFDTEVFCLNEDAQASGVVYSEMQESQALPSFIRDIGYRRKLYPEGNGYRSETGGYPEALQTLNMDKIKKYHSEYYLPHNLCLIVAGRLSTKALLEEVQSTVEARAISHGQDRGLHPEGWKRPFVETQSAVVPTINVDICHDVEIPGTGQFGELLVVMVGPPREDIIVIEALSLLSDYLSNRISYTYQPIFGRKLHNYCSSISMDTDARATFSEIYFSLCDVPLKHLDRAYTLLCRSLRRVVKNGIKLKRMHEIIDRREVSWKMGLGQSDAEAYVDIVLNDFLYGHDSDNTLQRKLQRVELYAELRSWTHEQWINVVSKWLIEPKKLITRSRPALSVDRPSGDEKQAMDTEEPAQVEMTLPTTGRFKDKNEDCPSEVAKPTALLTGNNEISWIPVQSVSTIPDSDSLKAELGSSKLASYLEADNCSLPYALHFDHASSQLVTIAIYISLKEVPDDLKHYIYLLRSIFFYPKITLEDGTKIGSQEARRSLERDLIYYSFDHSDVPEMLCLALTVQPAKYDSAIQWARRLLWCSEYSVSSLRRHVKSIKEDARTSLRCATTTMWDTVSQELYAERHTPRASRTRQQLQWLPVLECQLNSNGTDVLKTLQSLKSKRKFRPTLAGRNLFLTFIVVLNTSGLQFSIYGAVLNIERPRSSWMNNFETLKYEEPSSVQLESYGLSDLGRSPAKTAVVVALTTAASAHSVHCTRMADSCKADEAALCIAQEVLNGDGSHLWSRIRGTGLAYGFGAFFNTGIGHAYFSVYRSPDPLKVYLEASVAISGLVTGELSLDEQTLEAAKNRYAYSLVDEYSSPGDAAYLTFINRVMKGGSPPRVQEKLSAARAVTAKEVTNALKDYFLPLFDSQSSAAFVVCATTQAQSLAKGFEEEGFESDFREMDDRVPWESDEGGQKISWLKKLRAVLSRSKSDEKAVAS